MCSLGGLFTSGGPSQPVTQQYTANPQTQQLAGVAATGAQNLPGPGSVPLQGVAGLNPYQTAGLAGQFMTGMNNPASPYFGAAANMIGQSGTPVSGNDVANFYNPMAQNVTANLQDIFGQQMKQTTGNAIAGAGGVGADRIGVTQANLGKQQGLAAGQTYANLYQNALQAALQTKQLQGGAGALYGSLAPSVFGTQLGGFQAAAAAGQPYQQYGQNVFNSLYNQQVGQYQNPYQNLAAQQGVLGTMAGALGGQQQTTYPQTSPLGSIAGLAQTAIGAAGLFLKDGGRVEKQGGGGISALPETTDLNQLTAAMSHGAGSPFKFSDPGKLPDPTADAAKSMKAGKDLGAGLAGLYNKYQENYANPGSASSPLPGLTAEDYGEGFQEGGFVDTFDERFRPTTLAERFQPALDKPLTPPEDIVHNDLEGNRLGLGEKWDSSNPALEADAGTLPAPARETASALPGPVGGGAAPSGLPGLPRFEKPQPSLAANPWMALIQSGLGAMAASGKRDARGLPLPGVAAIGAGGMEGMKTLEQQREQARKDIAMQNEAEQNLFRAKMAQVPYSQLTAEQKEQNRLKQEALDIQRQRFSGGLFDPETVNTMAEQALAGDKSVFANLGRGVAGPQNIVQVRQRMQELAKARGMSGGEIAAINANFTAQTAAARTAAVRESNIQTAVEEAKRTFPLALEASENVPRGKFVPVNKAIQAYKAGTSDPALAKFAVAAQGAMIAYSQAMSRTGVNTVHAQQRAEELLSTATDQASFRAKIEQMDKEMNAALQAPEATRKAILEKISGKKIGEPIDTTKVLGTGTEGVPQKGERKQFKQGWGVWDGAKWVPE